MTIDANVFRPVVRTPLSLLVSRRLRDAIVAGELAVGSRLPTELELTEHFQVSRSTIREALRILQAQGLLSGGDSVSTSRPRVTSDLSRATASEALENALRLGSVPLADLVELRLLLEGAAALSADRHGLDLARSALEDMRRPGIEAAGFHDADVRFHIALVGAGGNSAFVFVMGALHDAIGSYLLDALEALDDPTAMLTRLASEHEAILGAVDEGDGPRARELVHAHILDFYSGGGSTDG